MSKLSYLLYLGTPATYTKCMWNENYQMHRKGISYC